LCVFCSPHSNDKVVCDGRNDPRLARDQWNLFALKVLSRLAQADGLNITVSISGKLKPDQDVNALNDALKQLGIEGDFNPDN
jgi:hypothetical protein